MFITTMYDRKYKYIMLPPTPLYYIKKIMQHIYNIICVKSAKVVEKNISL